MGLVALTFLSEPDVAFSITPESLLGGAVSAACSERHCFNILNQQFDSSRLSQKRFGVQEVLRAGVLEDVARACIENRSPQEVIGGGCESSPRNRPQDVARGNCQNRL